MIKLIAGGVGNGKTTACVMSLVALQQGEWSYGDGHPCVSRVIRALAIPLNDGPWWSSDAERTVELTPLAPLLAGTAAGEEVERRRAYRCADWAVREIAPLALEAAGRHADADRLCALAPIVDRETALVARAAAVAAYAAFSSRAAAAAAAVAAYAASRAAAAAAAVASRAAASASRAAADPHVIRSLLHGLILELIGGGL